MTEGICVPCSTPWHWISGKREHVPEHWQDRSPLARDELGRFSSEDRDAKAAAIQACDLHLRDLHRFHNPLYSEPPRKRGRGRPRKAG
jgi:hypothetical protein